MKAVATAENRPAYPPRKTNEHCNRDGYKEATHKDQGGIQVIIIFLCKFTVMRVGFAFERIVEIGTRATGRFKEAREERW